MKLVALDYQPGIFAVTNDVIETIGGRPPMSHLRCPSKHSDDGVSNTPPNECQAGSAITWAH